MSDQPFDIYGDTDAETANEDFVAELWLGDDDCSVQGEELYVDDSGLWDYDATIYLEGDDYYVDDSGLWDYDATIYPEGDDYYVDDTAAWDLAYEDTYVADWGYYSEYSDSAYTDYAVDDWSYWQGDSYWEGDSYYEPSGDSWYGEGDYTMFNVDGMTGMYGPGTTGEDLVHDLS